MNDIQNGMCGFLACQASAAGLAEQLNQDCLCQTLDRNRLEYILNQDKLHGELLANHPQLFSNIATFISRDQYNAIKAVISAIERVVSLPEYQKQARKNAPDYTQFSKGPAGVFMGYDFHLCPSAPQLIEINTNAGGAFLNALLLSAQIACCPPMQTPFFLGKEKLYRQFVAMFLNEWRLQRRETPLRRIAIVDRQPEKQFLFPEFKIAQQVFRENGISAVIAAPENLVYEQGRLLYEGHPIDLVYNRLTDFSLSEKANQALNLAYREGSVVVTPNPYHHAAFADKRNLILLSDSETLHRFGVSDEDRVILKASVPATCEVTLENANNLWLRRKELFFKPTAGYGGKAAYRGDKLTKRVWEEILNGQYIAQQLVVPSERAVLLDSRPSSLKIDVRAYTYQAEILLLTARLYQGQTTNFRTLGGGFSSVFVL